MKSRTLLPSVLELSACVADPDPDRPDASGAGGASESGGEFASGGKFAPGDASVDALLHELDVYSGPGCVAPVNGECPKATKHITNGYIWSPNDG